MKTSALKKLGITAIATLVLGMAAATSAQACGGKACRVYYLDGCCHYYYLDQCGRHVVGGSYDPNRFVGVTLQRDCCGRWYTSDVWGNKVYVVRRCGYHGHCARY